MSCQKTTVKIRHYQLYSQKLTSLSSCDLFTLPVHAFLMQRTLKHRLQNSMLTDIAEILKHVVVLELSVSFSLE